MCEREREAEKTETYRKTDGKGQKVCVFLIVEPQLSQGHPLTYDMHGARLRLSLGRSPSAPTDKTSYFLCSRQTLQLCIVWI